MTLREVAALLGADLEGDGGREIRGVAKIEEAREGDLTFVANARYIRRLADTRASAVIVGRDLHRDMPSPETGPALLRVEDPYAAFLKVLVVFHPVPDPLPPGVHPSSVIAPTASLAQGVRVGPLAVIGERCSLGEGAMLGACSVLGDDVRVGARSVLHAGVIVRERCVIGSRVVLHPGVVIGGDGFGFAPRPDGSYEKIPQTGIVVIEDDVELGANTTVDRATMGETRVRAGAKLDNLIMVAHNAVVGEHTVIAAQAGISGSTRIGGHSMIGGQAGITGHLEIAEGTRIGAQSGVHHSIHTPGTTVFGSPAYPQREAFRIQGSLAQLPSLAEALRVLQARLERLEQELERLRAGRREE
ncbi:MAG: UDP-3-O-(3-hydroxymyristoyl)glucosamine N-acyltransferase [Bacteroidota bacterium]